MISLQEYLSSAKSQPLRPYALAPVTPTGASAYGRAALDGEVQAVATAPEGERNHRLNLAAFSLAQLVAAGHLRADDVEQALTAAARAAGLDTAEISRTIRSGVSSGSKLPREVAPVEEIAPDVTITTLAELGLQQAVDVDETPSWRPVDISDILAGTHTPAVPTLLPRSDGQCLLYRGKTHSLHGESESGKSLVAQIEAVRVIAGGGTALYIDFESDAASVVARMIEFGAPPEAVGARFTYVRPEVRPTATSGEAAAFLDLQRRDYDLIVIDGVTESLSIWGTETNDNDGIVGWTRLFPRALADATGAAVVMIDHVTKSADTRGRFAIGGQAKMAALTGAAYVVDVRQPLGRGLSGVIELRVAKDREGSVRGVAGPMRATDRTQPVARITIDSTGDYPVVSVDPPEAGDHFRPTTLMERISDVLDLGGDMGFRDIKGSISSKDEYIRQALAALVSDGHVTVTDGPRGARIHHLVRPFKAESQVCPSVSRVCPDTVSTVSRAASPSRGGARGHTRRDTASVSRDLTAAEPADIAHVLAGLDAPADATTASLIGLLHERGYMTPPRHVMDAAIVQWRGMGG